MHYPILTVAIALVLGASSTALADKKKTNTSSGGQQRMQYMEYKFNTVYTTRQQPAGSNTKIHPPTGASTVTSSGLLGSSGGSGAGIGSKTKLPTGGAAAK